MENYGSKMEQPLTVQVALVRLDGMLAEQMVTGSMDSEPEDFNNIKNRLMAGEIEPQEAIEQAQGLIDSRQDYH